MEGFPRRLRGITGTGLTLAVGWGAAVLLLNVGMCPLDGGGNCPIWSDDVHPSTLEADEHILVPVQAVPLQVR